MLKLGKISAALLLGLLMSLTLFTSGVFAQQVNNDAGATAQAATAPNVLLGMKQNLQAATNQQATVQQIDNRCWWRWVFRRHRFYRVLVCRGGWWHRGWRNRGGWWHRGWRNRGGWWHRGWRNRGWRH
jgi:hypothetical protein